MRQKSDRISGTITLDGTPLKSGVVRLIPLEPDAGPGDRSRFFLPKKMDRSLPNTELKLKRLIRAQVWIEISD